MVDAFKALGVNESLRSSGSSQSAEKVAEKDHVTTRSHQSSKMQWLGYGGFIYEVERWIQRNKNDATIALFAIELDDFSLIYDVLGREVATALMDHATQCLSNGEHGEMAYAMVSSGRLFVAIPDVVKTEMIWQISSDLQHALGEVFHTTIGSVYLQSYVGISLSPLIAKSAVQLMDTAIVALVHARADNRENVCLYDSLKAKQTTLKLIRLFELKDALKKGQGIETYYQPKQSLIDDRIVGLEALVRWRHPKAGLLLPADFIELAEEKGTVCQITDRVLQTVCDDFHALQRWGFNGVISINISAKDFDRVGFVTDLCKTIERRNIAPESIELEITETAFINDFNRCYVILSALREIGFKLTIDDFGKGYSSLSYLKKLPVDTLKVDKAFISNIERSKEVRTVFEALLKIAHTQGLKVVAEGVETLEQKHILKQMNCDHIQGYLLSKPLPLQELNRWNLKDFTPMV